MPRDYRGTEHQLCVTEYSQWLGGQGLERVRRLVVLFGLWVRGARLPLRALIWVGFLNYPAPRVDHRFKDGDTIRLRADRAHGVTDRLDSLLASGVQIANALTPLTLPALTTETSSPTT
jgi:hypothetical protein